MERRFFFTLDAISESEDEKEFHRSMCLYKMILPFLDTILKHCKWIMLVGPAFLNESGHIKNSEDNYEDRGSWDPNSQNFPQQFFLRTVSIIEILRNLHMNIHDS